MKNTWEYKIDVSNPEVFEEIEEQRDITFPKELKDFILKSNAATPSHYNFMVGNDERVFGAVLSFDHNEEDTDSIFTALSVIEDQNLIPFGIDPFGNYICYSLCDKKISFWNHETDKLLSTGYSLDEFINSLY